MEINAFQKFSYSGFLDADHSPTRELCRVFILQVVVKIQLIQTIVSHSKSMGKGAISTAEILLLMKSIISRKQHIQFSK
jgi:hypothetical protein